MPKPEVNRPRPIVKNIFIFPLRRRASLCNAASRVFYRNHTSPPPLRKKHDFPARVDNSMFFKDRTDTFSASKKRDDAFENKVRRPPNEYLFSAGSDGIFALAGSQVFPCGFTCLSASLPLASAARKCYNRLMNIPSDPVMMLSALNMLLRDRYPSLSELCYAEGLDKAAVETALAAIDYRYDPEANQFV